MTAAERADVENVAPLIRRLVNQRVHWYAREDAFQEAMVAVCRARARWAPDRAAWRAFAYRRAEGAILDFFRDEQAGTRHHPVARPVSLDQLIDGDRSEDPLIDLVPHFDPEPPDHLLEAQLLAEVDRLSPSVAAAFRLHVEAGLTQREVGEVMGVTESRVCQHMKAARAALRPRAEALLA